MVGRHRRPHLRRPAQRAPGGPARRGPRWPPARDPTYPQPDGLWPGTGAILAAVEYATGRTAEIVGKPEPQLFLTALDRLGEGRTLVVGDRVDADLAAAAAARPRRRAGAQRRRRPRRSWTASSRSRVAVADDARGAAHAARMSASTSPTSTPTSAHASGVTVRPAARGPASASAGSHRRAPRAGARRRPPPRSPCSGRRGAPPRPADRSSRRSSGSSSSSAAAPSCGLRTGTWCQSQPGGLVVRRGCGACASPRPPSARRARSGTRSRPRGARGGGCAPLPPAARARTACAGAPTRSVAAPRATAPCPREGHGAAFAALRAR